MSFVRQSSFRHVFGTPAKPEGQFLGVSPSGAGDGDCITANEKFLAYPAKGGGGPVVVLNLNKPGRLGTKIPAVSVHKSPVLDSVFHPFLNTLLATAGDDCYVKVSQIPEGGLTEDVTNAIVTLEGHSKKVAFVKFHPTANNILASASYDNLIKLWDIEAQAEGLSFEDHTDVIQSVDFNADGSQIVTISKDKKIRVFDPRDGKSVATSEGFGGMKKASVLWASNQEKILGVGFSKSSGRQYGVWDPKKLDAPLIIKDLDQSSSVIVPYYDPDVSILYIAGKGDASISYFELTKEAPYLHFLSDYRDTNSQQGACFLPKRAVDTTTCEIAHTLRLMKDSIIPISFRVPRKSDLFQKDLYPDAYAGVPSLEAKEYLAGENKAPKLKSMKPGTTTELVTVKAFSAKRSPQDIEEENSKLRARIAELEAQIAKLK